VRLNDYYAHIIKALSSKYKIGLLLSDEKDFYASRKAFRNVKETEKTFRALCVQLGAEKIKVSEKVKGKVVIIPVSALDSEYYVCKFRENVSYDRLIGLLRMNSHVRGLDVAKGLGIKKYFVPAKFLFESRLRYEGKLREIDNLDIIEIGFPHKKYSVFNNLNLDIDYLVAYPSHTHFGLGKEKEKYAFINNLYKLLRKIDLANKVYLKRHDNNDNSQFFSSFSCGSFLLLKVTSFIADMCLAICPFFRQKLYRIGIKLKNSLIVIKYPSLEEVTQYHNLGIEIFLPHVRKGLITGNSGTQFHALYNALPVYNCDPQENDEVVAKPYAAAYNVPFCNGELVFDKSNFNRISKECRGADVIQLIKEELN
jgi:hypothetical protein